MSAQTGAFAPALTLTRTDAAPWRLADERGRPVLLVFLRWLG